MPQPHLAPGDPEFAALLTDVERFIRRYVVLKPGETLVVALWIVHTHAFWAARTTPYLSLTSAERRSGKSLLLEILALLVARPVLTSGVTEAALFRLIAERCPSLLIDEVDTVFSGRGRQNEGLRRVLNAGYRAGSPVYRAGPRGQVFEYDVFAPKALSGIGALPPTISDRSLSIRMKRRAPGEEVETLRYRQVEHDAAELKERMASWAVRHVEELAAAVPEMPSALNDRAQDSTEPLVAIADLAGPEWGERTRSALVSLFDNDADEETLGVQLLHGCWRVFAERRAAGNADPDKIPTSKLITALGADEESPFARGYGSSQRLTPRRVATLLKPFGIRSKTIRLRDGTPKGYVAADFGDAWNRYLPAAVTEIPSATSPQPLTEPRTAEFVTSDGGGVAAAPTAAMPQDMRVVADVAAPTGSEQPVGTSILEGSDTASLPPLVDEIFGAEGAPTTIERLTALGGGTRRAEARVKRDVEEGARRGSLAIEKEGEGTTVFPQTQLPLDP